MNWWKKLGAKAKTGLVAVAAAALTGGVDGAYQAINTMPGEINSNRIAQTAVTGAVMAVVGLWFRRPGDPQPPTPQDPPAH